MELKEKLQGLVELIDEERRPLADSIIEELTFTVKLLGDMKDRINKEGAITEYDNGKTINVIQSPAFRGYYTLIPKYNALIKDLINLMPKSNQETGLNALQDFMNEYN